MYILDIFSHKCTYKHIYKKATPQNALLNSIYTIDVIPKVTFVNEVTL